MLYYITITLVLVGLSVSNPMEERIVDGEPAIQGEFPFMVEIEVSGTHKCAGIIITTGFILTCAHCVAGISTSAMKVKYGSVKLSTAKSVNVKFVTIHEDYKPDLGKENDLALLELRTILQLSPTVQLAPLPPRYEIAPTGPGMAILLGWGHQKAGGVVQPTLMKVVVEAYTHQQCVRRHYKPILSTDICAGVDEGGQGQCTGDGGGAMLVEDVVVGIISWSIKPCTIPPHPGVSMRVSSYICWINRVAKLSLA